MTEVREIREVMTPDPVCLSADATIFEAAKRMRDDDIGPVIVVEDGLTAGVVTDRDIVVRALAEDRDPHRTTLREICSAHLITIEPDRPVAEAVSAMREHHIRRLPVTDRGQPIGMLSIGDLARELDRSSALADISAARPNH